MMQTIEKTILGKPLQDFGRSKLTGKVMLLFKGAISQGTLIRIGGLLRLSSEETCRNHSGKRVFSILVEMAQNILHYSQERELVSDTGTEAGTGVVIVQQLPDLYEVVCSNLVSAQQMESLESACKKINTMSPDELRYYYLEQRKRGAGEGSKGAGLGLIDIARKAKNPLVHQFHPAEAGFYYFTLSTAVHRQRAT